MIYRVQTYGQFEKLLNAKKASHHRGALLKDWKKWRDGSLAATCVLCDHRDASGSGNLTLVDWDCGCSYGCDSCSVNYKCVTCGSGFGHPNNAIAEFSSWLEFSAEASTVMSGN